MARQYLTPPSIPDDIYCRTLQIPNSPEWIGTLTGALYPLCFSEAWTQEAGGISPEEAAARFLEIFNAMFEGEGECVAGCCTELRRDPNTGRLQTSTDGGLTWFDVAEGPWVDAPNVPITTTPPPLNQGSDEADRCLAAANATSVIAEFYRQTAGEAGAVLYNTILSMNMFLNELNNALLELAYPQAGRLLNASGFLDFDWGEYAEAPTLDPEAQNALQCLLYCNSSVTDGVVSFDFGAVYDNLIAELGINPGTAVTLLVGYMQEPGLNHAGGVLANESAECDCPDCDDAWAFEWVGTGTPTRINNADWFSQYTSPSAPSTTALDMQMNDCSTAFTITRMRFEGWTSCNGGGRPRWFSEGCDWQDDFYVSPDQSNAEVAWEWTGEREVVGLAVNFDSAGTGCTMESIRIVVEGKGAHPFVAGTPITPGT